MTNFGNMAFWKSKYFWWSVAAVAVWICFSDFIIHQKILKESYAATSGMWRTGEEMQQNLCYERCSQFLLIFMEYSHFVHSVHFAYIIVELILSFGLFPLLLKKGDD